MLSICGFFSSASPSNTTPSPHSLYIYVDDRFTPQQEKRIKEAAKDWEEVGEGSFKVTFIWKQHFIGKWRQHQKPARTIYMWWVERSRDELGDKKYHDSYDDLAEVTDDDVGGTDIIVYHDLQEQQFKTVILHEFGHIVGLNHTEVKGRLMYPYVREMCPCIDSDAAASFCLLYGCHGVGDCPLLESKEKL